MSFITTFFLIVSSFFFLPNAEPYVSQELFVQYSAVIAFALSFILKPERRINNKWLGYVFLYCCANTILFNFNPVSRMALVNMFLGLYLVKFFAERIVMDTQKLGIACIMFSLLNILWIGLQICNVDPLYSSINPGKMPQVDIVGLMGIKFALGAWAALTIPFIFSVHPLCVLITIPLFYYSKSSTSVIAGALAFMFLLWFRHRKLFWVFLGLCISGCFYYVFNDSKTGHFMERIKVWWVSLSLLKANAWFGKGLGQWKELNVMTTQLTSTELKHWSWLHNDWLQYIVELGLAGAILLWLYLKNAFKIMFISVRDSEISQIIFAGMISLFVIATFHFPFHIGRLAGVSILILALLEANCDGNKRMELL